MQLVIGTYNILHPEFAIKHSELVGLTDTKESNWPIRKVNILKGLINSNIDIICLQEISKTSKSELSQGLSEAGFEIRHIENPRGDGSAIIFKKSNFSELQFKTLDLDEEKRACFVDLLQSSTKKVIRIANCHLQGGPTGPTKGVQQLNLVLNSIAAPSEYSIDLKAVCGDFNEDETKDQKKSVLMQQKFTNDGTRVITEPSKNRQIDWIFCVSSENQALELQNVHIPAFVSPASDHHIKATKITLR